MLFKLIGTFPKFHPERLIFDSFEVRWEAFTADEDEPNIVKKRRVRTLSAHVDIHISQVASPRFDAFIVFHRMSGAPVTVTYNGEWDVLRISAQRVSGNLARVNLSLQRRTAPAAADETNIP